jgi:hypothetical protein
MRAPLEAICHIIEVWSQHKPASQKFEALTYNFKSNIICNFKVLIFYIILQNFHVILTSPLWESHACYVCIVGVVSYSFDTWTSPEDGPIRTETCSDNKNCSGVYWLNIHQDAYL